MKKIAIYALWLLIIASGIAGFFFAPLWAFTALALYLRFSMTESGKEADKAFADFRKELSDTVSADIQQYRYEKAKEREAITFDDIHDAIHHLVHDKKPDQVSVWDWVYLRDDTQYNYLKSNQWLSQGGYYVYCDEQGKLHFGYDYQGIHWSVTLRDDLTIRVAKGGDIPKEDGCYGRIREKIDRADCKLAKMRRSR